jgi:tetratricopeptide (TPR) repeat protein
LGIVAVMAVGMAVFGPGFLAWQARRMALRQLEVGAITAAEQWAAWSVWFDPSDGRTDLVRASCLRQRYQESLWNEALELAERHKAPAELIQRERQLGRVQAGTFADPDSELTTLVDAGVSPDAVCTAFVHGYLARKDPLRAEMVLEAWAKENPRSAQLLFMRGVYWQWLADAAGDLMRQVHCFNRAEEEFRKAVAQEPRHEPARKALADLLEDQDRLEEALAVYSALATQAPANESAQVGLARVMRGLGGLERARAVLKSLGASLATSPAVAAEMGQIELASGNYAEAERWFRYADPETTTDADVLRAAATARAVGGDTTGAERLLSRLDRENADWARTSELLTRLATGSRDPKAEDELRRLTSAGAVAPAEEPTSEARSAAPASDLYIQHCAGCHGTIGDGNGRGARHLFPRARDFRAENFRLAGTVNSVPTPDDVASVIRRGMPGTSMRAYDELSDDERAQLAREAIQRRREGVREQAIREFRSQDEEIDEDEVGRIVDFCTTPGEVVRVPQIDPADSRAIARGKETYFALGCHNCHADDGTSVWDTPLYDEQGRPAPPRDLAYEPFKGGDDPESIYLRVLLGMPGTPHPSAPNVADNQLVGLVHFCRSLSREPKRVLTNHERAVETSRRDAMWAFELTSQSGAPRESRQGFPDR